MIKRLPNLYYTFWIITRVKSESNLGKSRRREWDGNIRRFPTHNTFSPLSVIIITTKWGNLGSDTIWNWNYTEKCHENCWRCTYYILELYRVTDRDGRIYGFTTVGILTLNSHTYVQKGACYVNVCMYFWFVCIQTSLSIYLLAALYAFHGVGLGSMYLNW